MRSFNGADEVFESFLPFMDLERGAAREPLKLDRMRALCAAAGSPERTFRSIHVAGTKGKGSVASMCASILDAAGIRAGLYVSPHVTGYRERITLAGRELSEESYAAAGAEVHEAVDSLAREDPAFAPSFFELLTLLAFVAFRREGCEWTVLETGLGGRLDATNVVIPEVSVLMPIGIEHSEYLGSTIPEIAREKAGIIKAGRPAVIARMDPVAAEVMRSRARELGSEVLDAASLTKVASATPTIDGTQASLVIEARPGKIDRFEILLPLIGRIQAENAAVAALAVMRALPSIGADAVIAGLSRVRIPARFEVARRSPLLVVDGSHTPASVACALDSWLAVNGRGGTLVFACAADKDARGMASALAPAFDRVMVTKPGDFKKSSPLEAFEAFVATGKPSYLFEDPLEALAAATARGSPALVTGSFYLAAIAREAVLRPS